MSGANEYSPELATFPWIDLAIGPVGLRRQLRVCYIHGYIMLVGPVGLRRQLRLLPQDVVSTKEVEEYVDYVVSNLTPGAAAELSHSLGHASMSHFLREEQYIQFHHDLRHDNLQHERGFFGRYYDELVREEEEEGEDESLADYWNC